MTNTEPMLVLDSSKESRKAKEMLKEKEVVFIPIYVDDSYSTLPTLISEGYSYKGIDGIKGFISTSFDNVELRSNK